MSVLQLNHRIPGRGFDLSSHEGLMSWLITRETAGSIIKFYKDFRADAIVWSFISEHTANLNYNKLFNINQKYRMKRIKLQIIIWQFWGKLFQDKHGIKKVYSLLACHLSQCIQRSLFQIFFLKVEWNS